MATLHKTDDAKQMMRSDPDGQMQQSKTIFCIKPRLATYPQCKQVPKQQAIIMLHRKNQKGAIVMLHSGLVLRQMESAPCASRNPFPDGMAVSGPIHVTWGRTGRNPCLVAQFTHHMIFVNVAFQCSGGISDPALDWRALGTSCSRFTSTGFTV